MARRSGTLNVGDLRRGATHEVKGNPLPYVIPPVAAIGNLIFAGVLSRTWGAYAHPTVWQSAWRAALILACSTAIVWCTWAVGRPRQLPLRIASLLMSTAACGGLFVFTFTRWSFDAVTTYLLIMITASIMLAVTKLLHGKGDDARANLFGDLGERVKELQDIGKTGKPKQIEGRIVTHTEMVPGADFNSLARPEVRTGIASALDVPPGGVRMIRNRNTPRMGRIEISPVDMLEHPPAWPGLSAPGGSIAAPLRIAVYQTGAPIPILLPGDSAAGRNAMGVMILLGQPGSGKTELQLFLAAEARSRTDAEVVYIDGRKGLQLPKEFRNAMHLMIHNAEDGERYLDGLVAEVAKRAAQIGGHGHEQWTAGCPKCPKFKVVIVDEASKFLESEDTLVELAESVRSVGLSVLLGIQRATGDRMPTSVRTAVGGVICMGVKDVGEGARVLSEETIEAGADPGWKNRKPGALYAELPGTDPDDWSLPGRTFKPDRDAVIAELLTHLAGIGETTGGAAATDPARPAAVAPVRDDDEDADPDADKDAECTPPPVDPDCPPDEDPHEPITVPRRPRIPLDLEPADGRKFTPAEVRGMVRDAILTGYRNGRTEVRPSNFAPLLDIVGDEGLKPPTLNKILSEFCQGAAPLLRKSERGVYEIVPPDDGDGDGVLAAAA
jgi:hypothetical protein